MSKKIYCIAMFKPKVGKDKELFEVLKALEADTKREDGCIQYLVTHQVENNFATGTGYPIVFNEIWEDKEAFETHCQREEIVKFFEEQCISNNGLVEKYNVCIYSDDTHYAL